MAERVELLQGEIDAAAKVVKIMKKSGLRIMMDRREFEESSAIYVQVDCETACMSSWMQTRLQHRKVNEKE